MTKLQIMHLYLILICFNISSQILSIKLHVYKIGITQKMERSISECNND